MELQIGSIVMGKVTGIAKFGAFVEVAPGRSGLVHISEIADAYVNEVRDHLAEGQQVQVKVVGIDGGKLNLSIKAAARDTAAPDSEAPVRPQRERAPMRQSQPRQYTYTPKKEEPEEDLSFEDKLKRFMKDSDSKISGMRKSADRRGSRRRGK